MTFAKDLRERRKLAESYGFELVRMRKHLIWRHPSGVQVVSAATASDRRAMQQFRRDLQRAARLIQQCSKNNANNRQPNSRRPSVV